jgi:hypothetical protein
MAVADAVVSLQRALSMQLHELLPRSFAKRPPGPTMTILSYTLVAYHLLRVHGNQASHPPRAPSMLHSVLICLHCTNYEKDMYRNSSFASTTCTNSVSSLQQVTFGLPLLLLKSLSTLLPSVSTSQFPIFGSQFRSW